MKSILFTIFLAATCLLPIQAKAQLNIVATVPALAQIAKAVAGEDAQVISLAKVGQDPHFVPGKPTLARHLAKADLLVTVGLALESGWLPPLMALSRNTKIKVGSDGYFASSDYIQVIGGLTKVDRSMGDVHPEGNPHWFLDPIRAAKMGQALAKRLAKLDPAHASNYTSRAQVFSEQLERLVQHWLPLIKLQTGIVTYHDSFRYFVDRFGIVVLGFVEPKPGVEASTQHLDDLIAMMKSAQVQQIWTEPYHMGRIAKRVAELSGAKIEIMDDAVAGYQGSDYIHMIETMLQKASGQTS